MGVIYLLTFSNGKRYVGQTREKNPKNRFARHAQDASRGINRPVSDAWRVLGAPNITMLGEFSDDMLNDREIEFIQKLNTVFPCGYNLSSGGSARATHATTKTKISRTVAALWSDSAYAERMRTAHQGQAASNRGARHAAKLLGEIFYVGSRCPKEHSGKRYTSTGQCFQCMRSLPSTYIRVGTRQNPRQLKLLP